MSSVYEFGPFRLDPAERLLLREGTPVSLTPKAFDVLVHLVMRHGHLVTKQELVDAVWAGAFVEEGNLTYTVSALRKALGNGQNVEQFIQTVPTKGYRFVCAVIEGAQATRIPSPRTSMITGLRAWGIVVGGAVVLALLAGLAMIRGRQMPPATSAVARFTIALPDTPLYDDWTHLVTISPDGATLALLLDEPRNLWLRPLAATAAEPVAGAEGAVAMAWAPDSRSLAVATPSAVRLLHIADKSWRTICEECKVRSGGVWTRQRLIVFTGDDGSLVALPEDGGRPRPVTRVDKAKGEIAHIAPQELPDGRLLFWVNGERREDMGFHVVDLPVASGGATVAPHRRVLREMDRPALSASGHLVYSDDGDIKARPFDTHSLSVTGPPVTLANRVHVWRTWYGGAPQFSSSRAGTLVYALMEQPPSQFHWVGREGQRLGRVADPDWYLTLDLSPDERSLATARLEDGRTYVWSFDLVRGGWTKRTFEMESGRVDPRWMPDGEQLVVTTWPEYPDPVRVEQVNADDLALGTRVSDPCVLDDVSRDGQYLICRVRLLAETPAIEPPRRALMAVPLIAQTEARVIYTPPAGFIDQSEMSPDSRWVAFNGNDSGRMEVYVVPVEQAGPRQIVSVDGGVQPRWRADGREMFYLGLDGTLFVVAVDVRPDGRLAFSRPTPLFNSGLVAPSHSIEQYAVSNDGQRFLMLLPLENRIRRSIGVLQNWPALVHPTTAPSP